MSLLLSRCVDKSEEMLWMYHIHRKQKQRNARKTPLGSLQTKENDAAPSFHLPELFHASCVVM
jgi:hypothetical protein